MAKKLTHIILLNDVKGLGRAQTLVKAPLGYVRNYLVPGGFAVVATEKLQREHEKRQLQAQNQSAAARKAAEQLAAKLSKSIITVRVKAGKNGKIFGSVGKQDIVAAATNQHGLTLTADMFAKSLALKKLGKHTIDLAVTDKVKAQLTVQVVSEKA